MGHKVSATMPKTRKSRSNRSQAAANLTGPGSPASSAGNLTINYTAMSTETLRFMLSQRDLNQSGPRRVLITRLQESDSPTTTTAPQVPEQLSAMIASIVEAKLANLTSRSTSGPVVPPEIELAQASATQPTPTGAPSLVHEPSTSRHEPSVVPTPPPARPFNGGQDGGPAALDLGNPEDVASIHRNYRLPSVASHLSNSQIAAITNGEYLDLAILLPFSSLLRDRVNSNLKLQVGNEGLTIPLPSPAQRPKITSIDRWFDAFAIYSSVILYSYPSRGVDLISYQQLIRESARKFPGMAWYVYDVEFRRRASHNLSKKWRERDVQLYLDTFTGLPKSILCKSCSSSDHFTDACPLSPRSKDSPGPNHADLCYNFNKGVPCARTPCPYRHQCNKPGCSTSPFWKGPPRSVQRRIPAKIR